MRLLGFRALVVLFFRILFIFSKGFLSTFWSLERKRFQPFRISGMWVCHCPVFLSVARRCVHSCSVSWHALCYVWAQGKLYKQAPELPAIFTHALRVWNLGVWSCVTTLHVSLLPARSQEIRKVASEAEALGGLRKGMGFHYRAACSTGFCRHRTAYLRLVFRGSTPKSQALFTGFLREGSSWYLGSLSEA